MLLLKCTSCLSGRLARAGGVGWYCGEGLVDALEGREEWKKAGQDWEYAWTRLSVRPSECSIALILDWCFWNWILNNHFWCRYGEIILRSTHPSTIQIVSFPMAIWILSVIGWLLLYWEAWFRETLAKAPWRSDTKGASHYENSTV